MIESKWLTFVYERFPLRVYVPFVFLFASTHYVVYAIDYNISSFLYTLVVSFLFFFALRLFDELKDYNHDCLLYPLRPLPRGLIQLPEVYIMLEVCLVVLCIMFGLKSTEALIAVIGLVVYLYLMYQEFFIADWLRPHLTTYAVVHTVVIVLFLITLFTALAGISFADATFPEQCLAFAGWFLFSLFEFGRKSFMRSEERHGALSYSKIFGKSGAVTLTVSTCAIGYILLVPLLAVGIVFVVASMLLALLGAGILYATREDIRFAWAYRAVVLLSIAVGYLSVLVSAVVV